MRVKAHALSGPAILLIFALFSWIAIWSAVWGFSHVYRAAFYDRVEAAIEPIQRLEAQGKEGEAQRMVDNFQRQKVSADNADIWKGRAVTRRHPITPHLEKEPVVEREGGLRGWLMEKNRPKINTKIWRLLATADEVVALNSEQSRRSRPLGPPLSCAA